MSNLAYRQCGAFVLTGQTRAGGVIGSQILQLLIPALTGSNIVAIVGQMIGAFAGGAALTVVASAIIRRRQRQRRRGSS